MIRAATIALLLGALGVFEGLLFSGCRSEPSRDPEPPSNQPQRLSREAASSLERLLAAPRPSARPLASAVVSEVAALRDTRLTLEPRRTPQNKLAFAGNRLAILGNEELVVRRLPDFRVILRGPLSDARALLALVDGSLLVVARDQTYWLQSGQTKLRKFPHLTFLPGATLLPDLREPPRFWLLNGFGGQLYHYALDAPDAGQLDLLTFFDLSGFEQRGFALLKDGSFIYAAEHGFRRFFSPSHASVLKISGELGDVRVFSARRLDQAWLIEPGGRARLVQLSSSISVLQTLELEPTLYDVEVTDDFIAALRVIEKTDTPRRFELCVYDPRGEKRFSAELPSEPVSGVDEHWVETLTRDKNLAVSQRAGLVAVGGPGFLAVWNAKTGERLEVP